MRSFSCCNKTKTAAWRVSHAFSLEDVRQAMFVLHIMELASINKCTTEAAFNVYRMINLTELQPITLIAISSETTLVLLLFLSNEWFHCAQLCS